MADSGRFAGARWATGAAVLVTAAGTALRLRGSASIFPLDDELMQYYEAVGPTGWSAFLRQLAANPHHMLLDPLSTRLVAAVSSAPFALRLPSVLWAAVTLWLLQRLGAQVRRPWLGIAAAALLAGSLLHIDWSRRCDFYALLTAAAIWTTLDFFAVLERPDAWPRLALSGTVFLLGHPYAPLMAVFQLAFAAVHAGPRRARVLGAVVKGWAAAGLLYLPWFAFSTRHLLVRGLFDFTGNPALLRAAGFFRGLPLGAQRSEVGLLPLAPRAVPAAAFAMGWLASLAGLRRRREPLLLFSHALLLAGTIAVAGLDAVYGYFYAYRQMLWLLPFYLLTVADGWWLLIQRRPRARTIAAVLLAAALMPALFLESSLRAWQIGLAVRMRVMMERVAACRRDGDAFLFAHDQLMAAFLYHFDDDAFRRIESMRLRDGGMAYYPPSNFVSRRDGKVSSLQVRSYVDKETPPAWRVSGSLYDMRIELPAGRDCGPGDGLRKD